MASEFIIAEVINSVCAFDCQGLISEEHKCRRERERNSLMFISHDHIPPESQRLSASASASVRGCVIAAKHVRLGLGQA